MKWIIIIAAILAIGYVVLSKFESMKGKSIEELQDLLLPESRYLFYRNAIIELQRRGEDIMPYASLFPRLLASEDKAERYRGWHVFKELYPTLAQELSFEPLGSVEACQSAAAALEQRLVTYNKSSMDSSVN